MKEVGGGLGGMPSRGGQLCIGGRLGGWRQAGDDFRRGGNGAARPRAGVEALDAANPVQPSKQLASPPPHTPTTTIMTNPPTHTGTHTPLWAHPHSLRVGDRHGGCLLGGLHHPDAVGAGVCGGQGVGVYVFQGLGYVMGRWGLQVGSRQGLTGGSTHFGCGGMDMTRRGSASGKGGGRVGQRLAAWVAAISTNAPD